MNDQNKYIWLDSQLAYVAVQSAHLAGSYILGMGKAQGLIWEWTKLKLRRIQLINLKKTCINIEYFLIWKELTQYGKSA